MTPGLAKTISFAISLTVKIFSFALMVLIFERTIPFNSTSQIMSNQNM